MKTITVKVINRLGLHARPSMRLAEKLGGIKADIKFTNIGENQNEENTVYDGKGVVGLICCAAAPGHHLRVTADGDEEDKAIKIISDFFADRCEEDEYL